MAYDIEKEIRSAVDTGKVKFGSRTAERELLVGDAKLIIMAGNVPAEKQKEYLRLGTLAEIHVYKFAGTSIQLGSICGKPYPVSMLVIYEVGNSKLLSSVKKKGKAGA